MNGDIIVLKSETAKKIQIDILTTLFNSSHNESKNNHVSFSGVRARSEFYMDGVYFMCAVYSKSA